MTDTYTFFLVLAAIYLSDCLAIVHAHAVCLTSTLGLRWRWSFAPKQIGNANGGIRLNQPFPPLGTAFHTRLWPVSFSPEYILAYTALCPDPDARPRQTGNLLAWDDIRSVQMQGPDLMINGTRFTQAGSPRLARHLAGLINTLRALPADQRGTAIKNALTESFDAPSVRSAVKIFNRQAVPLRLFCNLLFALLFLVSPALVWWTGLAQCWAVLLAALALNLAAVALSFRHAHRTLYPNETSERRMRMAVLLLNPPAAVRAVDALARDALVRFHPLTAVSVLCSAGQYRTLARLALTDGVYPAPPDSHVSGEVPRSVLNWHRAALVEVMAGFLRDTGADPRELLAPDPPSDDTCRSYCPRCRAQFEQEGGACHACGIPLGTYEVIS